MNRSAEPHHAKGVTWVPRLSRSQQSWEWPFGVPPQEHLSRAELDVLLQRGYRDELYWYCSLFLCFRSLLTRGGINGAQASLVMKR